MAETMVASPVKTDHNSRKNKKPLMEKRRRARINSCLSQLKSLVLQAIKKDSSQFSKLEKADILELTVKHLRALQRQQAAGVLSQDSHVVSKYRAGFNECAKEVVRYMGSVREVNDDVKERVVTHLANCLQVVNQMSPMESMQQQQQMKPLHVHIPSQQTINGGVTSGVAPSVIMHTAAVSQSSLVQAGLGGYGHNHNHPSPLRSSSTSSSSSSSSPSQDCLPHHHHTPSPVSSAAPHHPHTPLTALPLQPVATTASAGAMVVTPAPTPSPAFKLVPSGAGTVAVYVGTADSMPRAPGDAVSVDAVPLYSVSLPPPPPPLSHQQQHPSTAALTAFVTPTSHVTSAVADSSRYEDLSPVKAEYSPLSAATAASLPVDLRQTTKVKVVEEVGGQCPSLSASQCSPALAHDDRLWRPW